MSEGPKLPTQARLGILRVNFPRAALNLIRNLIKSASHLRVSYCGREFAAFNDLTLDADNQFEVFSHTYGQHSETDRRLSQLFRRAQFASEKPGKFHREQRVVSVAIEALKFATARLPEQKPHGLPTLWACGRRGIFWHGRLALSRREHYRTLGHRKLPLLER